MISTAPPPPKAGANGVRGGQGGSGDGCCDNVGSRARELIDRVPPCTSKYAFALHGKFYIINSKVAISLDFEYIPYQKQATTYHSLQTNITSLTFSMGKVYCKEVLILFC